MSINGLQSQAARAPVCDGTIIGIQLGDVNLLEIAAASRCSGEAKVHLIGSAEIFIGEIAGERASQLAVDPIGQRVSIGIPDDVGLVPISILDVAERFCCRQRLELCSAIGVDELRRFRSALGVESDGEPILNSFRAKPGAAAAHRVRPVRIGVHNKCCAGGSAVGISEEEVE